MSYEGVSDTTGVSETCGGAGRETATLKRLLRSDLLDCVEVVFDRVGRRCSWACPAGVLPTLEAPEVPEATADCRGAARLLLTLENRDVTRA